MYQWRDIIIRFMVFYTTFNNISVISGRSVLLLEEAGVPEENHRPVTDPWKSLSIQIQNGLDQDAPRNDIIVRLYCKH